MGCVASGLGAGVVGLVRCVGFGVGGVVAGSLAAFFQYVIGPIAKGSWFALCQSVGATGSLIKCCFCCG